MRLAARYAGQDLPRPRIKRSRARRWQNPRRPAFDMRGGMAFDFLNEHQVDAHESFLRTRSSYCQSIPNFDCS